MANTRKVNRKNRRGGARKNSSRRGLFRTLYGPIGQALGLTGNVVSAVTNTTRNVAKRAVRGVDRVGLSVTGRANAAVRNLVSRKRRNSRKSRRNSRR
jgi:hypothetical protein